MPPIIYKGQECNIVVMDSATYMEDCYAGDIIVCGSHGGTLAAAYLLTFSPGGAIFNDAGRGKEDAGIMGLNLFQQSSLPAAAVDTFSARIGEGMETHDSGVVSAINDTAAQYGIRTGMNAKSAALIMSKKLNALR